MQPFIAIGDRQESFGLPKVGFWRFWPIFRQFWLKFYQFLTLKDPEYPKTGLKPCPHVYFKYVQPFIAIGDGQASFELPKAGFWRFRPISRQFWLKFDQFLNLKDPEYPKTDLKPCPHVYFRYMQPFIDIGDGQGTFQLPKVEIQGSFELPKVRFWRFRQFWL